MKALLLGSTAFLLGVGEACAQTASPNQSPASDSATLGEVVVTAQRREENLQQVPIAITALPAAQLAVQGISEPQDLVKAVPALTFARTNGYASPYVRGIGNSNSATGDEPSVATYIDGVYIGSSQATILPFNGVERIEVLKGPQGTLFGRNATGGLINIITRAPSAEFQASAEGTYANYNTKKLGLYVTGPLSQGVRASLSAQYYDQGEGYGRNLLTNRRMGREEYGSARARVNLDLSDTTTLDLSADYTRSDSDTYALFGVYPGTVPLAASVPGTRYTTTPREIYANGKPSFFVITYGFSARLKAELGFADFVSISAYRHTHDINRLEDPTSLDNTLILSQPETPLAPALPGTISYTDDRLAPYFLTQEFQLLSSGSGPFTWVAGLFGQRAKDSFQPLDINAQINARPALLTIATDDTTRALAAYGQGAYRLDNGLAFTLGGRYTTERRHTSGSLAFPSFGLAATNDQRATFHAFTWRAAVDYRPTPDLLVYVSANKGFKSGLFNPQSFGAAPVRPETIYAYEVGFKSDPTRRLRINGSAYYYDYKNIQLFANNASGTAVIQNANAATMKGAELEAEFIPIENLHVRGAVSYERARYTGDRPVQTWILSSVGGGIPIDRSIKGAQMVRAPEFTANLSATYDVHLSGGDVVTLGGSYFHSSSFPWEPTNRLHQKAYNLVDLSAKWTSASNRYSVSVWGKNVFDEDYMVFAIPQQRWDGVIWAPPATYGVTFGLNFD